MYQPTVYPISRQTHMRFSRMGTVSVPEVVPWPWDKLHGNSSQLTSYHTRGRDRTGMFVVLAVMYVDDLLMTC